MKPIILSLILAVFSSTLVAAPSAKSQDKAIIAGRSIGDIHVGERQSKAEKAAARHGESSDGDSHHNLSADLYTVPGGTLTIRARRQDMQHDFFVYSVRTTSPQYHTASGLHVGSKFSEIRARYPHAKFEESSNPGGVMNHDDQPETWVLIDPSGISFEFASREHPSRCISIEVSEP